MKTRLLAILLAGTAMPWAFAAEPDAPVTPKAQFAADNRATALRYTSDKALCTDEASSSARLQCRRDAKAEYDKARAEARARLAIASPSAAAAVAVAPKAAAHNATLLAPPAVSSRSCAPRLNNTGTGASGLNRSAAPKSA